MPETHAFSLHKWGNEWGRTSPPVVLLHGFTGSGASWEPIALGLARQGLRVLAPDLPGHGQAPLPDDPETFSMAKTASALGQLLDAHTAGPVHLLGYSMGGRLALYFALAQPQRLGSLVLESASPGLATAAERAERRRRDDALADRIQAEGIEKFVDFWESLPLWASQRRLAPNQRQQLRRQRLQNRPAGLAASLRGMGTGVQPNLWPRLAELKLSALLLAGAEDEKFVAINRQMAGQMPDARLEIVPAAGHTVHLEQPERFVQTVYEFWRGLE